MSVIDEVRFIDKARRGDVEAFNRLVLHHQDGLYNYALRMTGNPAAADDATQQAFISAFKAIRRFQEGGNFKSWLYKIAHNKCIDSHRSNQRRPAVSIDQEDVNIVLMDDTETPDEVADRKALIIAIQNCLSNLSDDHRSTIVLCDVEGYGYEEIAGFLGIQMGTVKSRISRARRKMQSCLKNYVEVLPTKYH